MALTTRRRTVLALAALGVPLVGVLAVLGLRAAGGPEHDTDARHAQVAAVTESMSRSGGSEGYTATGATAGPDRPMSGGSTDGGGLEVPHDVTVVCTSVDAVPARLTVDVAGKTVVDREVECGDGSSPDGQPAITNVPDVALSGPWSFAVAGGTEAAVGVAVVGM
jgi:hypothetical protein